MITVKWRNDLRLMAKVEKKVEDGVGKGVDKTADLLVDSIRSNWYRGSGVSPRGGPPGVVTENLDSSVKKESTGRDAKGRFASKKDAKVMFVRIDTSKGDDPGNRGNYGPILEGKLNRPFVEPAIERIGPLFGTMIKREVKL